MYQRIMLTTDGSDLASAALPHAAALTVAGGATVVLVAAVDSLEELRAEGRSTGWLDLGGGVTDAEIDALDAEQRAAASAHLAVMQAALAEAGVATIEEHVVTGSATRALVQAASDLRCDLVVIATHGRSGLGRVLLGSVADHLARHADRPVLLVRPELTEVAG